MLGGFTVEINKVRAFLPGSLVDVKPIRDPEAFEGKEFEFKVMSVTLAETMKRNMTKQVTIEAHPQDVNKEMVDFIEKNIKHNKGKSTLKFTLADPKNKMRISLVTMNSGFEMNEEMIRFLEKSPELDVQVLTV